MSEKNNGGQAFPQPVAYTPLGQEVPSYPGMTLRDYFAAKAMQAAISGHIAHYGHDSNYWPPKDIADYAKEVADAMLAAREVQS